MKCPHCSIAFRAEPRETPISSYPKRPDQGVTYGFKVRSMICPECYRMTVFLIHGFWQTPQGQSPATAHLNGPESFERMVYPPSSVRICPADVPSHLKQDFEEACMVLPFSPKASAALSRRCLQELLRTHACATHHDLSKQIDQVIESKQLSPLIGRELDAVREIGNFAAHTMKDTNTGEILPVEPGEAEWNLDVLESLFQFLIVTPADAERRINALNPKLTAAGRKPV
jgi:hypothetical protein